MITNKQKKKKSEQHENVQLQFYLIFTYKIIYKRKKKTREKKKRFYYDILYKFHKLKNLCVSHKTKN